MDFAIGVQHRIFNNEVRKRREAMGLTQKQLEKLANVGGQKIGNIESFRVYPTKDEAERIAEILDAPIDALFPKWLEIYKPKRTSIVTETIVTEKLIESQTNPFLLTDGSEAECAIDRDLLHEELEKELSTLSPREKKVLTLRYGLDPDDQVPRTFEEVSAIFGVTRERIRQIEKKAMRRLRHPTRSRVLKQMLDKLY